MKVRFNHAIEFEETDNSVSSDGMVLQLDKIEMDMMKFFDSGHSLYSIKRYILKNYHLSQIEYAKRLSFLIDRLTKNNFIDLGITT